MVDDLVEERSGVLSIGSIGTGIVPRRRDDEPKRILATTTTTTTV